MGRHFSEKYLSTYIVYHGSKWWCSANEKEVGRRVPNAKYSVTLLITDVSIG